MQDFEETSLPPISVSLENSLDNKTGSWRYFSPKIQTLAAPCRSECPVGNDIPGFIRAIAECRLSDALEILRDENPFPGVCGRVCFRFCQKPCHRKQIDTQIKIGALEKLAADYGRKKGNLNIEIKPNGLCVAIIGAGPAGLSCAYFLARLGYQVDIFDSQSRTGGSMQTNKKVYDRLPEHVIERETQDIFELGVNFFPNHTFGTNLKADDLRKFNGVYVALPDETAATLLPAGDKAQIDTLFIDDNFISGIPVFTNTVSTKKRWIATYSIAIGKSAAISIDQYLSHNNHQLGKYGNISFKKYMQDGRIYKQDDSIAIEQLNLDNLSRLPLADTENCPESIPDRNQKDKNLSLSFENGIIEARKCLGCGTCNLCALCYYVCPDLAVIVENNSVRFNYEYCKGCGICIKECPRGAIGREVAR
jgi:Pyruvate/2-oxoacid:ferredoxin oxidoreductase delta subunit